jgi:hypothetical protein
MEPISVMDGIAIHLIESATIINQVLFLLLSPNVCVRSVEVMMPASALLGF